MRDFAPWSKGESDGDRTSGVHDVAFPGNQFKGEIVPALQELVDAGTIRVIDLAFVIKDGEGNMAALEAGVSILTWAPRSESLAG